MAISNFTAAPLLNFCSFFLTKKNETHGCVKLAIEQVVRDDIVRQLAKVKMLVQNLQIQDQFQQLA